MLQLQMKKKLLTLVFIRNGMDILLGYKKRGFGQGKWNGFGGKLMEGESIEDAAKRLVQQACFYILSDTLPFYLRLYNDVNCWVIII